MSRTRKMMRTADVVYDFGNLEHTPSPPPTPQRCLDCTWRGYWGAPQGAASPLFLPPTFFSLHLRPHARYSCPINTLLNRKVNTTALLLPAVDMVVATLLPRKVDTISLRMLLWKLTNNDQLTDYTCYQSSSTDCHCSTTTSAIRCWWLLLRMVCYRVILCLQTYTNSSLLHSRIAWPHFVFAVLWMLCVSMRPNLPVIRIISPVSALHLINFFFPLSSHQLTLAAKQKAFSAATLALCTVPSGIVACLSKIQFHLVEQFCFLYQNNVYVAGTTILIRQSSHFIKIQSKTESTYYDIGQSLGTRSM